MDIGIDSGIRCFEHAKAPWPIVLKNDLRLEHDSLMSADPKTKEHFVKKVCSLGAESVSPKRLHQLLDKMVEKSVYFCATLHAMKYMHEKESKGQNKDMLEKLDALDQMQSFFAGKMVERNIKILVGQDGLIPQFTFDEMRYLNEVGLSESEIVKGATIYPAQWLGVADQFGSVLSGMKANILILDKNPLQDIQNITTTRAVLKDGSFVLRQ
jgi:imidazolonepropionase-like amidohydrolase